jgi:hypothetical protein
MIRRGAQQSRRVFMETGRLGRSRCVDQGSEESGLQSESAARQEIKRPPEAASVGNVDIRTRGPDYLRLFWRDLSPFSTSR